MAVAFKQSSKLPEALSKFEDAYKKIKQENAQDIEQISRYNDSMERFYQFLKSSEDNISHMYLDSQAYPTVGCGHLLGFNWSISFWEQKETRELLEKLKQQIKEKELLENMRFRDFTRPEDIIEFFTLEEKDFASLFKIQSVSFSLLEALDLPFRTKKGVSSPQSVYEAFSYLLKLSLYFYTRQKALNRTKNSNPFKGTSFYHEKDNNLVLDEECIKELAYSDIKLKIFQLEHQLNSTISQLKKKDPNINVSPFFSFPLPAKKGLLDLKFNGARLSSELLEYAVQQKWDLLLETRLYGRSEETYKDRNAIVKGLFKEALQMQKNEKTGKDKGSNL